MLGYLIYGSGSLVYFFAVCTDSPASLSLANVAPTASMLFVFAAFEQNSCQSEFLATLSSGSMCTMDGNSSKPCESRAGGQDSDNPSVKQIHTVDTQYARYI